MDKFGDMDLFVRVVRNGGLAAAGREIGLSPSRVTARINGLEQRYNVRLLNRTTRSVAPTEEGRSFYSACERVLSEVERAEVGLQTGYEMLAGPLRVTATIDLGREHIASLLTRFCRQHPAITPYLHLSDGIANLIDEGLDVAVRYGPLTDSSLVARQLTRSHRVVCASPDYIKKNGTPQVPEDLASHACLAMVRASKPITAWTFLTPSGQQTVTITPARSANDGGLIRQWALEGEGLALKSLCDIVGDLENKRLVTVLDEFSCGNSGRKSAPNENLYAIYPSKEFLPSRTSLFVESLVDYFDTFLPGDERSNA